ncbi:phosphorylethanolamine cytidylyltransferase 1 [Actinidia rufa]|uniref:Phosphorylethanolamine cytidylyltransferase 1 n=1 Tax=Actinidia rufa TaxID=165716 RepID=A0A7J0GEH7_9ERIC|nr:phosphorylethanolamine cytidylyltransferase 1 [Actinidia rufa]
MTTFNISLVVHGTVAESNQFLNGKTDPYAVPKSMGIFQMLESPKNITTSSVSQRIIANHEIYKGKKEKGKEKTIALEKRNAKKEASEKKYYEERKYVSGD